MGTATQAGKARSHDYQRAKAMISEMVAGDRYAPGDKLPSLNRMGRMFRLGRNAVQRGVAELVTEGRLVCRHGSGVYVADPGVSEVPAVEPRTTPWDLPLPNMIGRPRLRMRLAERFRSERAAWERVVARFAATHHADIEILPPDPKAPDYADPRACIQGADLLQAHSTFLPLFIAEDVLLPLADWCPEIRETLAEFPDWCTRDILGEGAWGVPTIGSCSSLFANLPLIEKSGIELEALAASDLEGYLRILSEAAGRMGSGSKSPALCSTAHGLLHYFVVGGVSGGTDIETLARLPAGEAVEFLDRFGRIFRDARCFSRSPAHSFEASRFQEGGTPLLEGTSMFRVLMRPRSAFPWAMLPAPMAPGGRLPTNFNFLVASAAAGIPEIAAQFVRFAGTREAQDILASSGRLVMLPESREAARALFGENERFEDLHAAMDRAIAHKFLCRETMRLYEHSNRQFLRWQRWEIEARALIESVAALAARADGIRQRLAVGNQPSAVSNGGFAES